jgi:hypothetical protein
MYADNELLFPPNIVSHLRRERGEVWRDLVDRVAELPDDHPESLAFSLMMVRLGGCLSCETDSYRAMRGCSSCAKQVLRRYKSSDTELLERYHKALDDIRTYLLAHPLIRHTEEELAAKAA